MHSLFYTFAGKVAIYAQDTYILLGILTYFQGFRDTFILLGIQGYLYTFRDAFILFGIQGYLYTFKELGILAQCRHVLILFRIEQPLIQYCLRTVQNHILLQILIYFCDSEIILCFFLMYIKTCLWIFRDTFVLLEIL